MNAINLLNFMKNYSFSKMAKTALLSTLISSGVSWSKNPEPKDANGNPLITIKG